MKPVLENISMVSVFADPSSAVSSISDTGLSSKLISLRLNGRLPAGIVVIWFPCEYKEFERLS